jgi:hypothetical protein
MAGFLERLRERRARRRTSREERRKREATDQRAHIRTAQARKDSETRSWEKGPGSGTDV